MRLIKILIAFFALLLAGCTFQSEMILPEARDAGDVIAGLPTDRPFTLESFDRQIGEYHAIGTMTPTRDETGMRYVFMFNQQSDRLAVRARKFADNSYVLRYTETGYPDESAGQTALVFLTEEDGTFYLLTSLADKTLFKKVYGERDRPEVHDTDIMFTSMDQAAHLATYFTTHREEFRIDQDYIRIRLGR